MTALYFAQIESKDSSYTCLLREIYTSKSYPEFPVKLGPNDQVKIKGKTPSLEVLLQKLANYKKEDLSFFFDDGGQSDLGQYLFDELFRPLSASEQATLSSNAVELRIVTDDEHVARLPWCLLHRKGSFLTTEKWSVALSPRLEDCIECLLPPSPRLLFVVPQPNGWGDTEAAEHLLELERLLSTANPLHIRGKHLRVVETWNDLSTTLANWEPHIVYYYGHGTGDENASRVIFADEDGNPDPRSVADFAKLIRSQPDPPKVVYVNCCKGDVGGFLGVSFQLGPYIPAVITNCTTARVDAAREQARTVWKNILVLGVAPHEAIVSMRRRVVEPNFSLTDVRWMTPVMHYRYKKWEFKAPSNELRLSLNPHWDNLLDRTKQTGEVVLRVGSLLQAHKRHCLAFLWHGHQGQGVNQFYQRLKLEIQDRFPDVALHQVTPAWPQELHNFNRSITDMLTQAFEVASLAEIPHAIRSEMQRKGAHRAITYLRHPVLNAETELSHPTQLQNYLEWLDKNLASEVNESTCLLIGFGLEHNGYFPGGAGIPFSRTLFDPLESFEFNCLTFYLLEELGRVERRDLVDFMRVQNYRLPVNMREGLIASILEKTGGQYERVVEELKEAL